MTSIPDLLDELDAEQIPGKSVMRDREYTDALYRAYPTLSRALRAACAWLKADNHFWEYENECGVEHGFDEVIFNDLKEAQVKAREAFRASLGTGGTT